MICKSFYEFSGRQNLTVPFAHTEHWFDVIRQHTMCIASETLLYTNGKNLTGDEQVRSCRDWNVLRDDWATDHSACELNGEPIKVLDPYNLCHGSSDRLPPYVN